MARAAATFPTLLTANRWIIAGYRAWCRISFGVVLLGFSYLFPSCFFHLVTLNILARLWKIGRGLKVRYFLEINYVGLDAEEELQVEEVDRLFHEHPTHT